MRSPQGYPWTTCPISTTPGGSTRPCPDPRQPRGTRRDQRLGEALGEIGDQDTKRDRFLEVLREVTGDGVRSWSSRSTGHDGCPAIRPLPLYGGSMGCYSGRGGEIYEDSSWRGVSKAAITERLRKGRLRVLLCTDAASRGPQPAGSGGDSQLRPPVGSEPGGATIGRIDRIGQAYPVV